MRIISQQLFVHLHYYVIVATCRTSLSRTRVSRQCLIDSLTNQAIQQMRVQTGSRHYIISLDQHTVSEITSPYSSHVESTALGRISLSYRLMRHSRHQRLHLGKRHRRITLYKPFNIIIVERDTLTERLARVQDTILLEF